MIHYSEWAFLAVVFSSVLGAGLTAAYLMSRSDVRNRLQPLTQGLRTFSGGGRWLESFIHLSRPLSRLSIPDQGWEGSPLKIRFMNAGLRQASAPIVYFGLKTILALGFPAALFFYFGLAGIKLGVPATLMIWALTGGIGYYVPNLLLSHLQKKRQRQIVESFPDILDLVTVCVEAGLSLDLAFARVATEVERTAPALSEELHLVTLELRAGASKEKALRNLALRTGNEDVDSLVALLIQAERFGTSIAESLRVQAGTMRTLRRQRAEETAATLPVKLLLPLIFCIFPSILLVVMGPAMLSVYDTLVPTLNARK